MSATLNWTPEDFERLAAICDAPAPSGMVGAKRQIIRNEFKTLKLPEWEISEFNGNGGIVLDTAPGRTDLPTVCLMGHLDQIRLLVSKISSNGKIQLTAAESFLPLALVGTEAVLYLEDPKKPGTYKRIMGTIEAIGAKHFASTGHKNGSQGIKAQDLYFECGLHGDNIAKQAEELGIRTGNAVLLHRPVKRYTAVPNIFGGAYLDNGLGCFATVEVARCIAKGGGLEHLRLLFSMSDMEEIGRFGSKMLMQALPAIDVLIAFDVGHDYKNAPNESSRHMPGVELGKGFVLRQGANLSREVNSRIMGVANRWGIPYQLDCRGKDPGTDALAAITTADTAAVTIGFPIRNMHTSSELGHMGDLTAAIEAIYQMLCDAEQARVTKDTLVGPPVDLSKAVEATLPGA